VTDASTRRGTDDLLDVLRTSLGELADAVAGAPGQQLRKLHGTGAIATAIRAMVRGIVDALTALAAAMARVETWVALADATLALLELLAESIDASVDAGAAIVRDLAAVTGDTPPEDPLGLTTVKTALASLRSTLDPGIVSAALPRVADIAAVRRELTALLEPTTSSLAPPRSLVALARRTSPP
jgi:hypothetical protein